MRNLPLWIFVAFSFGSFAFAQSVAPGAVSIANGGVASGAYASGSLASGAGTDGWNVTEGTKADSAYSSGSGSIVAILKGIFSNTGAPIPSGSNTIGNVGVAQGSTTSGQNGPLAQSASTTAAPSYSTGLTNPLSTDLNGGLRISPMCNKVINVAQTTSTDLHTFTGVGYVCSIMLVSATAQNIGIDEGTGTTCETSGTALIGVSSTASATPQVPLAANGGFSMVAPQAFMKMQAGADHLCLLQSGSGEVAGVITYADLTN